MRFLAFAKCRPAIWMIAVVVGAGFTAPVVSGIQQAQDHQRLLYVTVDDGHGGAVTGLTPAEFAVKEGGVAHSVVLAEAATSRMHIALIVSEGFGTYSDVRQQIGAFIRTMTPMADVSLIQIGQTYGTLVDYTANADALVAGLARIGSRYEGPTMEPIMTRGIVQSAKALVAAGVKRPAVVAIVLETDGYWTIMPDDLRGVIYDSLKFQPAFANGSRFNPETNYSGGRSETATTPKRVGEILSQFAADFSHQYALTYVLPEGVKPKAEVSVTVGRRGVTLRAPTRIPDHF